MCQMLRRIHAIFAVREWMRYNTAMMPRQRFFAFDDIHLPIFRSASLHYYNDDTGCYAASFNSYRAGLSCCRHGLVTSAPFCRLATLAARIVVASKSAEPLVTAPIEQAAANNTTIATSGRYRPSRRAAAATAADAIDVGHVVAYFISSNALIYACALKFLHLHEQAAISRSIYSQISKLHGWRCKFKNLFFASRLIILLDHTRQRDRRDSAIAHCRRVPIHAAHVSRIIVGGFSSLSTNAHTLRHSPHRFCRKQTFLSSPPARCWRRTVQPQNAGCRTPRRITCKHTSASSTVLHAAIDAAADDGHILLCCRNMPALFMAYHISAYKCLNTGKAKTSPASTSIHNAHACRLLSARAPTDDDTLMSLMIGAERPAASIMHMYAAGIPELALQQKCHVPQGNHAPVQEVSCKGNAPQIIPPE